MTATTPGEPTLADVQAQFPHWQSTRAISGLYHAQHEATGQRVTGEDPLDLRDQIKAADARHAWHTLRRSSSALGATRPGPASTPHPAGT